MAQTEVGIRLTVDGAGQARQAIGGVEQELARMSGAMQRVGHYGAGFVAITQGLVPAVQAASRAADAVTTLHNQLKLATGSAKAAGTAYEALFGIAQRSRVSFVELGGTFASISRAGQELGLSQQRLLTVTESIGNAMTISGGSAASMNAALLQLSQGMASGTLRGEELNSVMEQTPRLAKAIADGLGVPIGKLREMGAAGQLSADQVVKALERQAAVLKGEVAGASVTVGQAMTQLGNATTKTIGELDKASGVSSTLASSLSSVASGIGAVGRFAKEHEAAIAATVGALTAGAGAAALAVSLGKVAVGVRLVGAALAANPYVLALMGIGAVVAGVSTAADARRQSLAGMRADLKELEAAARSGGGIYGHRASAEAVAKRTAEIKRLRTAIAELDAQSLDTRAEDARLAAHQQSAKAATANADAVAALQQKLSGTPKDYLDDMQEVIRLNQSGALVGKAYTDVLAQMQDRLLKKGGADKEAAKAAKEYATTLAELAGVNADYVANLGTIEAMRKAGLITEQQQVDLLEQLIEKQPQVIALREQEARGVAVAVKAMEEANKAEADRLDVLEKSAASAAQRVQDLEREEQAAALAAAGNITLAEAVERLGLARAQEAMDKALAAGADGATLLALQKEIEARERLIELTGKKGVREAGEKAAKDAATEWKRAADKIEDTLTDALMRGFESGKGFARTLRDTVVNMFKTMVLQPVVRAIVSPIAGALTGAMGFAGSTAQAAQGGSNLLGTASNISTVAQWSTAAAGWGTAFGQAAIQTISGTGFSAAVAEGTIQGLAAGAGATGSGIAATVGAAAPYVLAAVAVAAFLKSALGRKTISQGVRGEWSGETGEFSGSTWEFKKGGALKSDKTVSGAIPQATLDALNTGYGAMAAGLLKLNAALGGSVDALKGFSYRTMISTFKGTPEQIKANMMADFTAFGEKASRELLYQLAGGTVSSELQGAQSRVAQLETLLQDTSARKKVSLARAAEKNALQAQVDAAYGAVINPFLKANETAAAALGRLTGSLAGVNSVFELLNTTLFASTLAGADLASGLLDAFGGGEAFQKLAGSFFSNFYTAEEQHARKSAVWRSAFDEAASAGTFNTTGAELAAFRGASADNLRSAYRDLVEAQDLTTAAGQAAYVTLMNLAPALADIAPAFATVASEASDAADAVAQISDVLRDLQGERKGLERQLLELQGGDLRAFDTAGYTAAEVAAYDYNAALRGQIEALQDARDAAQAFQEVWGGIATDVGTEARRIRGVLAQDSSVGYAALQSRFAIETAQARAGDAGAGQSLASHASELLAAAADQVGSSLELVRLRAQVAQSLEETAQRVSVMAVPAPATAAQPLEALVAASQAAAQATQATGVALADLKAELATLKQQLAAIQTHARRTADAVNGLGEAPMAVEIES